MQSYSRQHKIWQSQSHLEPNKIWVVYRKHLHMCSTLITVVLWVCLQLLLLDWNTVAAWTYSIVMWNSFFRLEDNQPWLRLLKLISPQPESSILRGLLCPRMRYNTAFNGFISIFILLKYFLFDYIVKWGYLRCNSEVISMLSSTVWVLCFHGVQ